jgi:hypothetical protein
MASRWLACIAFGLMAAEPSLALAQGQVWLPNTFSKPARDADQPERLGNDCPHGLTGADAAANGGGTSCFGPEGYRPIGAGSWVRLNVSPEYARVYVNGSFAGTAQQYSPPYRGLRIGLGPHLVQLRAPGHKDQSFWIMQPPDRSASISRTLQAK